ncbi:MAG: EAL domain-containing protein [Clostridia bacterium]|nr:EAL domain-containing protein [Clostridia bacterium]
MDMKDDDVSVETALEDNDDQTDARFVKMTLDSGVAPLEIRYSQINSCYKKTPVAYRSYTYINSVVEGVVSPEKYSYASDETEVGIRLANFNLKAAMDAVEKFIIAGRDIEFISVRIPPKMVLEDDFYSVIKTVLDKNDFKFPDKLCLEFPRTVLFEDEEKVRLAILSMKLLKVKTMMSGCGEKDSPVTPLVNLPFDYLVLSPFITTLIDNRDKGNVVSSFLAFLRDIPSNVIGDGVYNDDQITALSRADCFGYIPSSGYEGDVSHGRLRMPLDEALAQKEEEEF